LSSFSQTDTTEVRLSSTIARLVVKDLILGDRCTEELELTNQKLEKVLEREQHKDTIINLYRHKDTNNEYIIRQQELQIYQYEKMTDDLMEEIRQEKNNKLIWKVGAIIGAGIITSLLLK
jgi:hypothetical protein